MLEEVENDIKEDGEGWKEREGNMARDRSSLRAREGDRDRELGLHRERGDACGEIERGRKPERMKLREGLS